jgi:hypothetical protein
MVVHHRPYMLLAVAAHATLALPVVVKLYVTAGALSKTMCLMRLPSSMNSFR